MFGVVVICNKIVVLTEIGVNPIDSTISYYINILIISNNDKIKTVIDI